MKKIFVKNYGCQMNIYDTNKLLAIMSDKYEQTDTVQDADLVKKKSGLPLFFIVSSNILCKFAI